MGRDRTQEFFACVESLSLRSEHSGTRLLSPGSGPKTRGEFTKAASLISNGINETLVRLSKLTNLARKKSMFEDKPTEINELIYVIKQDLAKINHQIGQLAEYLSRQSDQNLQNKQIKEHSHNVISSLQSKLANTSDTFKSVLKVRSDNLKLQKERKDQYSYTRKDSTTSATSATTDSPLYHPERRVTRDIAPATPSQAGAFGAYNHPSPSNTSSFTGGSNGGNHGGDAVIDFGGSFMQQQLQEGTNQNSAYLEARDQTIESIESTIAELGQVYTRFASVLAEQREMVQRIDDNVMDVEMNVEGAHGQLLKYYQGITNNRGLMVRSFAVVVVFFGVLTVLT